LSLLRPAANDAAPLSAKYVLLMNSFRENRFARRPRISPIALAYPASVKLPVISHSRYEINYTKFLKNYVYSLSIAASSSENVLRISFTLDPFFEFFSLSVSSWSFSSCSFDFLMTI